MGERKEHTLTFEAGGSVFKSPLEDFKRAADAAGLAERMIYLSHGETYDFEVPASRWQQSATP